MAHNVPEPPSSPFWIPKNQVPKEFKAWISDPWYFREALKGFAEAFTPDDFRRVYRAIRAGIKAFFANNGLAVDSMNDAFYLGLHVGHAVRKELFE